MIYTTDYITVAEGTTYFATRLYSSAWTSASAGDKASAIRMATQAINSLAFKGRKYDPDQANAFPRYIPYPRGGYYLADEDGTGAAVVPAVVKEACAEECLELLTTGNSSRRKLQNEGVTSFRISELSETFGPSSNAPRLTSLVARQLMKPYLVAGVPIL